MTTISLRCPKCAGEMEDGFIADMSYGGVLPSKWVEGKPEKSFWTGTKMGDKETVEIKTYRCIGCGFLELYAR